MNLRAPDEARIPSELATCPAIVRAVPQPDRLHPATGISAASRLRRLDWRWLLPTPETGFQHMVLLGGDAALAELAVTLGVARRVSRRLQPAADLVVVLASAHPPSVAEVSDALKPGGVVYWETDRTRCRQLRHAPNRVTVALGAVGMIVDARYALRPHPDRCELYLPLDHPIPVRWYLDDVYVATRRTQMLGERLVRRALDTGISLGHLAPYHAIVAHRPPAPGPTITGQVAGLVRFGEDLDSTALLTDSGNRVVVLGFGSGHDRPTLVVKAPQVPSHAAHTANEQRVTRHLRQLIGPTMAADLADPLGSFDIGGCTIAAETGVGGRSMQRRVWDPRGSFNDKRCDLEAALTWIGALHRDHAIRADVWDERRMVDVLIQPIQAYRDCFGRQDDEDDLFAKTAQAAAQLLGVSLPVVWQHRDYSPSNLTRDGFRVRVLDWESGRPGIPFADPLRFAILWHEGCRRLTNADARGIGLADLFANRRGATTPHPAIEAVRGALSYYGETVGVDTRFMPVVLVASAVELAVRRAEQRRPAGSTPRGDERRGAPELERISHLVTWRDRLFADEA